MCRKRSGEKEPLLLLSFEIHNIESKYQSEEKNDEKKDEKKDERNDGGMNSDYYSWEDECLFKPMCFRSDWCTKYSIFVILFIISIIVFVWYMNQGEWYGKNCD